MTADLDTLGGELYASGAEVLPSGRAGSDDAVGGGEGCAGGRGVEAARAGFGASREQFESLVSFLDGTDAAGLSHAELEERLDRDGRELLRRLLDDHLALRAVREPRLEQVVGDEGVARGRVEPGHARILETVFGAVTVERLAYRAPGLGNLHPADAALNLPVERHSHGLRKLAALEAARGSFQDAVDAIGRQTGLGLGKRQVEELAGLAAIDFEDFYEARRPKRSKSDQLLVLSADGKGIVMRPDALRTGTAARRARAGPKPKARLAGGEKLNCKRMAEIGAVYDAVPAPRTPADILARDDGHEPAAGPVAANKWLTASIVKNTGTVIKHVFDEADRRDPKHRRTWVALVDGNNHQIQRIKAEAKARMVKVTIIVDFIHVLEYLWTAAGSLFPNLNPAEWVHLQATRVLEGHATKVARTIRRTATNRRLDPATRKLADDAANYLTSKAPYLDYPTALANGWPIATGIIEGACRHLVKDRMDITGARWGLAGAEAILKLRALKANGDFDTYWDYHLAQERHHVHEARYHDHVIPSVT
ncbi:MAG TPA: ISKra4 family transposase [Thermoanaerobaculia bacterium]|nr:ISKra4 family transposase [Thermoanaerobaculia bacterium]